METNTENIIKERELIHIAASWKSESENPNGFDPNYKAFCQVMECRKQIATALLKLPDLGGSLGIEQLNHCNKLIRDILGV